MNNLGRSKCLLTFLFGAGLAAGLCPDIVRGEAASTASEQGRQFDIPAQSLNVALRSFAETTGLQLVYASSLVNGLRNTSLKGTYKVDEALRLLLSGTGLTFRIGSGNTVVLERAKASDARVLGPVRVEGAEHSAAVNGINGSRDVTATEGTGSYTSGALMIGSKIAQSMKDTPQSVSVLSAQRLEEQNIIDFNDAMAQAPGITLAQGSASLYQSIYSRGFTINSLQIDGGAPLAFNDGGFHPQIDMAQYDHVEVLRGAAAYFNGYGDPSGTVNLVRKKPLDHAQTRFEAKAGSWNNYRAMLDATAPLAWDGKLRGRLVFTYQDNDYFYDLANDKRTLVYGIAEYDVTPSSLLSGGVSYTRQNSLPGYGGLPRYQNGDDLELSRNTCLCFPWNRWDIETTQYFGTVEQQIGSDWSAKLNVTSTRQENELKMGGSSGAVNPLTGMGPQLASTYEQNIGNRLAAEATLSGHFRLLGQRQEIVVGANRSVADSDGQLAYASLLSGNAASPYQPYPGGPTYYSGSPFGSTPPIDVFNFDPSDPRYTEPRSSLPQIRYLEKGTVQTGAYLNARFTAFDRWHLAAAFRYSRYEYQDDRENLCTSIPASGTPSPKNCVGRKIGDGYAFTSTRYSEANKSWPPAVSLSYDITHDLTAHVGYTDIYQSQSNRLNADLEPVDPITGSNIEVGLKWRGTDDRWNLSLAGYRIEQEGFAVLDVSRVIREGGVAYVVDNAGNKYADSLVRTGVNCCYLTGYDITMISRGVEAELIGELVRGWHVSASYSHNENERSGADLQKYSSVWIDGEALVTRVPQHVFKLWTTYRFSGAGWTRGLTLGAGANGQSKSFQAGSACTVFNPPNALGQSSCKTSVPYSYEQSSYAIYSARIDYDFSDHWGLAVNVDNLADKRYYRAPGGSTSSNWYGEPRSFAVSLQGRW